jgi:GT2 family glycosyltransferase
VLFLDGDCVLDRDWVTLAEQALRDDPGLGGVAGASYGLLPGNGASSLQDEYPRADYENPTYLAGSAAYKRDVLLRAGGFNPRLYACEEEELGARVRKAGFRMRRLRAQMSLHHPRNPKETVAELIRRLRRRYFVGLGQLTRHALAQGLPIERPAEPIRRHLAYFALLVLGIAAAIASLVFGTATFWWAWTSFMTGLFLAFALRARELRKPAYYFLEWTLASPMVVYGILLPPHANEWGHAELKPAVVKTAGQAELRA